MPQPTKTCTKCKLVKTLSEFYRKASLSKGVRSECKICDSVAAGKWRTENKHGNNTATRVWRKTNPKKRRAIEERTRTKFPKKHKAGDRLRHAVKTGKIVKPDACTRCGSTGMLEGHHEDYAKSFDVIWLCRTCHHRLHVALRTGR